MQSAVKKSPSVKSVQQMYETVNYIIYIYIYIFLLLLLLLLLFLFLNIYQYIDLIENALHCAQTR